MQSDLGMETIQPEPLSQQDITFKMTSAGQNTHSMPQVSDHFQCSYLAPNTFSSVSAGNQIPRILNTTDEPGGSSNLVATDRTVGTGIKLRTRETSNQANAMKFLSHETASRRIRLQMKWQDVPVQYGLPQDSKNTDVNLEKKELAETEVRYFDCEYVSKYMPELDIIIIINNILVSFPSSNTVQSFLRNKPLMS